MPPEIDEIETSQTDENKERQLTPREIAMNAITVVREKDDDAPDINAKADDQLALQTDAPRVLTEGLDKTLVTVKVDGVEQQIPVADVVRSYQKDAAATQRLAEASRVLDEARRAAAVAKPPAAVDDAGAGKDTPSNPEPETVKGFVEALFEGDTDKAVEAFAKLGVTAGRANDGATLDIEQLAAQLKPEIRQQLIDDAALERFEKANADLAADPHLVSVTNGFIQEAVNGGKSYAEALEAGATRTRDWLTSIGATKAPLESAPTNSQPSKLERKAGIDEVQALNRTANTTQSAPESPSQVIAAMKKARGQE